MSIPDAPWVGKCREDYYGCDDEEQYYCADCDEEFDLEELIGVDGRLLCKDCFEAYCREEEDEDEELCG